ncbi:hypothetical protein [uncultured Hymenobacter sp.]|uniref:hypothetical protein n=1 Tax=uncultured Hymenobacter sp. TaxID=170016 RepID=UPI0035CA71F8
MLLALGGALGACSSQGHEPRPDAASALRRPTNLRRPAAARPLINLPPALPLAPAAFRAHFGRSRPVGASFVDPGKALADKNMPADSVVLFELPGLSMVVSFQPGTRRVYDVLLLGADEATLMRQATLRPDDTSYLLLPVFDSRRADHLLGLRVIPK